MLQSVEVEDMLSRDSSAGKSFYFVVHNHWPEAGSSNGNLHTQALQGDRALSLSLQGLDTVDITMKLQ